MKTAVSILLLTAVLLLSTASLATAAPPVGGCPPGFELHEFMTHDEPGHVHVGLKVDLNGDGMICVRHISETIHVHMDNVVR